MMGVLVYLKATQMKQKVES